MPQCISPGHSYIIAYWYLIFQAVSATGENVVLAIVCRTVLAISFELLQCHAQDCVCERFGCGISMAQREVVGKG